MSSPLHDDGLRAIVRDPEDDERRLALARSIRPFEPDLAAFIDLQVTRVQRQRQSGWYETDDLPDDERRLLARHAAAWARGVARYANRAPAGGPIWTFHRGLVAHVAVDPELFTERGAVLLEQAPIRHVDFAPLPPGALAPLLASDALTRLDSVGFAGVGLDDDAVAEIAACPRLSRCLYLDLSMNPLGPRAFAEIAASPHLRQLLVVERAQDAGVDPALTSHPGEIVMKRMGGGTTVASLRPITDQGRALEAAHGDLPWLRRRNRVSRFDARWCVDRGIRPLGAAPPGSP